MLYPTRMLTVAVFLTTLLAAGCLNNPLTSAEADVSESKVKADCESPAPITNEKSKEWTEELGYIVVYHKDEDRTPEEISQLTERLAEKYGFSPGHTYAHVLQGFAAELSEEVLAQLRCESVVKDVTYNGTAHAAGG